MMVFIFWITILPLIIIHATSYRQFRVDLMRQKLFIIRDNLFIDAAKGEVDFSSSAYTITRTTLNSMLRYANQISITDIVMTVLFSVILKKKHNVDISTDYTNHLKSTLDRLNEEQRKLILATFFEMHMAIMGHLVMTSWLIILAPITLIFKPIFRLLYAESKNKWITKMMQVSLPIIYAKFNDMGNENSITYATDALTSAPTYKN